jgi:tripartite ATP-independent transporter DctM subunit
MTLTVVGVIGIIALMCVIFLLSIPVSFAMAIVGLVGFIYVTTWTAGLNMAGSTIWNIFSSYGLTVIPLFILMGQVAFHSGVNERLYDAAYKWIGHIKGGLATATVAACAAFAAICGSNTATAATMTTVAFSQMKKYNYDPKLSLGVIACGSTLGVVIPPSVILIIIGLSTEQSIADLFYGGVGAGLLLTFLLALTAFIVCTIKPKWGPVGPRSSWKQKWRALAGTYEMVILFVLIIVGLYAGFFTPTEAGAVGAFLTIAIGMLQKKLTLKKLKLAIIDTLSASCMVITIIAGAVIFGKFLAVTRLPYALAEWVAHLDVPKAVIMLVIFAMYVLGGAIMDALALLLITIPIFFPVAIHLGYDPLWFGVTITVITTLGAITPPVGATTYVVAGMAKDVPLSDIFHGVMYFIPAYIICIAALMIFPQIVTLLPTLLRFLFGSFGALFA